jgi:hypothetical protein
MREPRGCRSRPPGRTRFRSEGNLGTSSRDSAWKFPSQSPPGSPSIPRVLGGARLSGPPPLLPARLGTKARHKPASPPLEFHSDGSTAPRGPRQPTGPLNHEALAFQASPPSRSSPRAARGASGLWQGTRSEHGTKHANRTGQPCERISRSSTLGNTPVHDARSPSRRQEAPRKNS